MTLKTKYNVIIFFILQHISGPSPAVYTINKIRSHVSFRGGQTNEEYCTDEEFFEFIDHEIKSPRLINKELTKILNTKAKKLTKNQKLIKSVIEEAQTTKIVTAKDFKNLEEMYEFRRKYKNYPRIKRIILLSIVARFTSNKLSKMAYAAAIGSKSITLTLPGLILLDTYCQHSFSFICHIIMLLTNLNLFVKFTNTHWEHLLG